MFRREFGLMPGLIRAVTPGDTQRATLVSLGRDRVKERHPNEMIRHGRFGPVRVVGYLLRDVRPQ